MNPERQQQVPEPEHEAATREIETLRRQNDALRREVTDLRSMLVAEEGARESLEKQLEDAKQVLMDERENARQKDEVVFCI